MLKLNSKVVLLFKDMKKERSMGLRVVAIGVVIVFWFLKWFHCVEKIAEEMEDGG